MPRNQVISEPGKKYCHLCKTHLPISKFGKNKYTYDGLQAYCKECRHIYYQENKHKRTQKLKEYRQRPEVKKRMKKYLKKYVAENRESLEKTWKNYREANKESIKITTAKYRKDNKIELRVKQKEIYDRYMKDIYHRIRMILLKRISKELKNKPKYTDKLLDLLGCTIQEFMDHIELQFNNGMSWDNYGEWELDHIKPVSLFDLTKQEEQENCFKYRNMQPLSAHDNRVKYNKWDG